MPSNPQVIDVRSTYSGGTTNAGTAFSPNPVAGGVIVYAYVIFGGPLGILAPDDNYGNIYHSLGVHQTTPSGLEMMLWMATNIATGPGHQVVGHVTSGAGFHVGLTWAIDFGDTDNGDYTVVHILAGQPSTVGPTSPAPAPNSIFLAFFGNLDGGASYGSPTGWNTVADGFTAPMFATGRAFLHHGFFDVNAWSAYKISSSVETATWQAVNGFVEAIAFVVSISPPAVTPTPTDIVPDIGTIEGGTPCTITGTSFAADATVDFDGVPATDVVFVDDTTITCVSPAHAAGNAVVTVTQTTGTGSLLSSQWLYALQPVLDTIEPQFDYTAGGETATLRGSNFASGATVTFGGTPATGVVVVDPTEITCTIPAHAAGVVPIVVTNT